MGKKVKATNVIGPYAHQRFFDLSINLKIIFASWRSLSSGLTIIFIKISLQQPTDSKISKFDSIYIAHKYTKITESVMT